jgi:hypothetical protein
MSVYKPKSKRRKMRQFQLEEISVVDSPAQKGAVATIFKRAGELCTKGQTMTPFEKLQRDMATLNHRLDAVLEATFEKERVHRPGRTAAQHRGDWPPHSDEDPAPGKHPGNNTRVDDYVSGDEASKPGSNEMTPERASQVLQPYADHSEEPEEDNPQTESDELFARLGEEDEGDEETDEEVVEREEKIAAKAHDLMKRDPRMSPERATAMALQRVAHGDVRVAREMRKMGLPTFGREREYAKRAAEAEPQYTTYTDNDLENRLEKRFGKSAVERARAMYRR